MTRIFGALRLVRPWQWLVLLALFAIGAGGTYGIYQFISETDDGTLTEDQQLIPVQRDDLITSISINGSLAFPNTETASFETQGTLGELAVEEGQLVRVGEPLGTLDEVTVAGLEETLALGRFNAAAARDALADAMTPHSALEIAQAEAKVADAKEALLNVEQKLLDLFAVTEHEIATADSTIADAVLKIDTIRDDIATLTGGPDQGELDDLRFQEQAGKVVLENALRDQSLAVEDWSDKTTTASDDIATAVEEYRLPFEKWLGVDAESVYDALSPDTLLAQWGADLDVLFDKSQVDHRLISPPPVDDPDTAWNEQIIYAFTHLSPYDIQPACEEEPSDPNVYCISVEMAEAWDKLVDLRATLDNLQTQADTALSKAQDAVVKAEESLADIAEKMSDLREPPNPLAIQSKEKELALSETSLAEAKANLEDLLERFALGSLLGVSDAKAGMGEGIDTTLLTDDMSESFHTELLAAQKEVDDALLALRDAEEALAAVTEPPDPLLVALREAELATAELDVQPAAQQLTGITLTSPIAGVVTEISGGVGDSVNPSTSILTVVDPTVIEMEGAVDEIDVLYVHIGASANVTMDALPGEVLPGTVSYIASDAISQHGVVTYDVSIRVEAPPGIELRSGLTAIAELVLRSEPDVLLVPLQALRGSFNQPTVLVSADGVLTERAVSTGSSDDFWVVVVEGLNEGELIVMEGIEGASDFGFGGFRGIPGAGFGGGFRPSGGGRR